MWDFRISLPDLLRGPVSPDRGTRGNSSRPKVHIDKIGPPARAAEPLASLLPVVRQMKERGVRTRGVNHENYMRGGTDRVPDGIIVSGRTSLRNADRRSNQSVAALGALVAQKRGLRGCALRRSAALRRRPRRIRSARLAEEASRLLIVSPKGIFWSLIQNTAASS